MTHFIDKFFHSLLGTCGLLPEDYSEEIILQLKNNQYFWWDFYAVFNKIGLQLMQLGFSQTELTELKKLINHLDSFLPDNNFFYYANLFLFPTKNRQALAQLIEAYFSIPCNAVKPTALNIKTPTASLSHLSTAYLCKSYLGLITQVPTQQLVIYLGPISYKHYEQLLLDPNFLTELTKLIRDYLAQPIAFKLSFKLIFSKEPIQMSKPQKVYLGWNSWLGPSFANNQTMVEISVL